jgi:DNA-directed RNA polymerase subunit K/omega
MATVPAHRDERNGDEGRVTFVLEPVSLVECTVFREIGLIMVRPPPGLSAFEFVVLASLRTAQLTRGCTPRVEGTHKRIVIAQLEVSSGVVARALSSEVVGREPI